MGGLNQGRQILLDRGGYDTGVSVLAVVLRFTVWVLVILAVVWIVREILRVIAAGRHLPPPPPNPALAELEMLYARGEVSRTDFLARRADLGGLAPPVRPAG
jgi:hypothetical protein